MPYQSKAQARLFFSKERKGELPKGTARRWAHHTPNMKKLPQHKKKKNVKRAYVEGIDDALRSFGLHKLADETELRLKMNNRSFSGVPGAFDKLKPGDKNMMQTPNESEENDDHPVADLVSRMNEIDIDPTPPKPDNGRTLSSGQDVSWGSYGAPDAK